MGGWVRKRAGPSFCTCNNVGGPKTNPKKKQIAGAGAGGGGVVRWKNPCAADAAWRFEVEADGDRTGVAKSIF